MEKKLTNSDPLREPADKHSIYTMNIRAVQGLRSRSPRHASRAECTPKRLSTVDA